MKTQPVVPARITFDSGVPFAPEFGDVYHSRSGALEQAHEVFLAGNRLPARWQGRDRFVVLETGFGLGNNFLATRAAWRDDARRCERLWFVSIDKHPPVRDDLARAHAASPLRDLAQELVDAWPPLTPNLHRLTFDAGRVTLLLAFGDIADWLPEIVASVDAFFLDGFAPARNPQMWDRRIFKALGRLAAPGATAATWSVARDVRDGLTSSGFAVERMPGFGGKREMMVARFAPAFVPRRPPARSAEPRGNDVLVIGAGLAGASAAWALAALGFQVCVLEASRPAQGGSGNSAGLFHGTVHAHDGVHARFNRAAALDAARVLQPLINDGLPGCREGLLRLDAKGESAQPAEYVQRLDVAAARAISGWPLPSAAWLYPQGGWIDPSALVQGWLQHAHVRVQCESRVHALQEHDGRWQAFATNGALLAQAHHAVVANAHDATRLLGDKAWPLQSLRGQITHVPAGSVAAPRLPIAGAGYAIPMPDGSLWCGATSQLDNDDPSLRTEDHGHNLDRLVRMSGSLPGLDPKTMNGRVGWRLSAIDRLPLIGAVPEHHATNTRLDQPRFVPRVPGLYVYTALGSRGITWSALGAQVLASWIAGTPFPVEASLIDAVDPARFTARQARKASS